MRVCLQQLVSFPLEFEVEGTRLGYRFMYGYSMWEKIYNFVNLIINFGEYAFNHYKINLY